MKMAGHIDYHLSNDCAKVRLDSAVNQQSILGLCDVIDVCVNYYHYLDITIQIDSPGGEANYLEYFSRKLELWRKTNNNIVLRTEALAQAASAAALILSLGDRRSAYVTTNILFHTARVVAGNTPLVACTVDKISKDIKKIDQQWLKRTVDRVIYAYQKASHHDMDFSAITNCRRHRKMLTEIYRILAEGDLTQESRQRQLRNLYSRVFERDEAMSAAVARAYYLIDEVI